MDQSETLSEIRNKITVWPWLIEYTDMSFSMFIGTLQKQNSHSKKRETLDGGLRTANPKQTKRRGDEETRRRRVVRQRFLGQFSSSLPFMHFWFLLMNVARFLIPKEQYMPIKKWVGLLFKKFQNYLLSMFVFYNMNVIDRVIYNMNVSNHNHKALWLKH